jgi:hypothetical protein
MSSACARAFFREELNQFEACLAAVFVGINSPGSVDGIVIIADGIVNRMAASGEAREPEVRWDGAASFR